MAKKKQVKAETVSEVLTEIEERLSSASEAVDIGISGDSEQLRRIQRTLVFVARDASAAASRMYTLISLAENQEKLRQLEDMKGRVDKLITESDEEV